MPAAVRMRRPFAVFILASGIAIALVVTFSSPVRAATFSVNTTVDASDANVSDGVCEATSGAGDCTLRAAVEQANALAGTDTITVPGGSYLLTLGQLTVTESVAINGDLTAPGGDDLPTIDGNDNGRVFDLRSGADVAITGVAIVNGTTGEEDNIGGGILVRAGATLNLVNSFVTENFTPSDGGGIAVSGSATLTDTSVLRNVASDEGGGILVNDGATVTVIRGVVHGNRAGFGGGINNDNGTLTMTGAWIASNNADSEISDGGFGGGIWTDGATTITASTISGNTADVNGGGIFSLANDVDDGDLSIVNSTISGNSAVGRGGGIHAWATDGNVAEVSFSTIASNTADRAGGLWVSVGEVELFATIVANNVGTGPQDDANCFGDDGDVDSQGSNLSSDATCDLDQASDKPNTNPMLGTLAFNGGPTQTHALLVGSPAIDAVVALPEGCAGTDQRGVARPQDGDSNGIALCDIGAYELALPSASINDVSVTEGNGGTVDAVFTVTLSAASSGTVTMAYATADGTATAPADYLAAAGSVTFLPGDTSETITVKVVGDTLDEPNETFVVTLSAPVGATLATLADAQGTGTILDDEGPIVTPAPTPAAAALPDTGTGGSGLEDWGGPGVAIGLLVLSLTVLIRNRRRHIRAR